MLSGQQAVHRVVIVAIDHAVKPAYGEPGTSHMPVRLWPAVRPLRHRLRIGEPRSDRAN